MFKAAGLAGIIISAGLLGIMKAYELKEKIKLLEDFLQMLLEIKGQINYFRQPLINIFNYKRQNIGSEAFIFLDSISVDIAEKEAEISQIWAYNIENIYGHKFSADELDILKFPGTFIGQTDYENQIAQFNYAESRLTQKIASVKAEYMEKGPLFRKIGFFMGGLAALIFI